MQRNRPAILLTLAFALAISSCKKTTYTYPPSQLTSYFMPLQVGKYITYRLDSLTFYYYGQSDTLTHYLAKDSVEAAITDNQGRPSWRVVRYLSDTTGVVWTPSETYMVTPTVQTLEMVENNLRYIKLAFPMDEGFSWTGNTHLPYAPYKGFFDFSDDSHLSLQLWNYTYQNVNKPFPVGNQVYDSTATVLQKNDSINLANNLPIIDTSFASRTNWTETYARNIGLIYRHTALWEYQPPTPNGTQTGYKIGFEVTLSIVDHN
ncbi:MAG TPA: hypothetical protein VF939_13185 [Puia sp.]